MIYRRRGKNGINPLSFGRNVPKKKNQIIYHECKLSSLKRHLFFFFSWISKLRNIRCHDINCLQILFLTRIYPIIGTFNVKRWTHFARQMSTTINLANYDSSTKTFITVDERNWSFVKNATCFSSSITRYSVYSRYRFAKRATAKYVINALNFPQKPDAKDPVITSDSKVTRIKVNNFFSPLPQIYSIKYWIRNTLYILENYRET